MNCSFIWFQRLNICRNRYNIRFKFRYSRRLCCWTTWLAEQCSVHCWHPPRCWYRWVLRVQQKTLHSNWYWVIIKELLNAKLLRLFIKADSTLSIVSLICAVCMVRCATSAFLDSGRGHRRWSVIGIIPWVCGENICMVARLALLWKGLIIDIMNIKW